MTFQQMQAQKDKNSAAWHGADKATQDKLHQENLSLQAQMDKLSGSSTSFDKNSGTYKPSTQTSAVGGGSGSQQMFAGSGSTGSSYTPTSSTGYKGSADFVGVNDTEQQKIKDQMNANSQAWHTADAATKAWLQNENKRLSELLGGSVSFDTGTGKWSGTAGVTGPSYTDFGKFEEFQDKYYDGSAERAAIDAYIKQSVLGLESQKSGVSQSADEAARQAYIGYMQSQAAMPQALSAAGYSGGMADSQRLALDTTLQNNQKDILLNRDNALNDIDTAIQKTRLEGSIQAAQSQAQLGRDAVSAYLSYISQKNAQASQDYWSKYGYDFQGGQAGLDREFQAGQSQANRDWQTSEADKDRVQTTQQKARDDVINLLLSGYMPQEDMLTAAGIDKNTAQGWFDYARQQAQRTTRSSNGGYINQDPPKKEIGPTPKQYDAAADRFDAGDYSQEVIDILLAAGENPDGIAKAAGFTRDISALGFGPVSGAALANLLVNGDVIPLDIGGNRYYRRAGGNSAGWGYLPTAGGYSDFREGRT